MKCSTGSTSVEPHDERSNGSESAWPMTPMPDSTDRREFQWVDFATGLFCGALLGALGMMAILLSSA